MQTHFNSNIFAKKYNYAAFYPFEEILAKNATNPLVLDRLLQSFTSREIFLQEYVCENYKWWKGYSIYDFNSVIKLSNHSDETSELINSKVKSLLTTGKIEEQIDEQIDDKSKNKSMIKISKKTPNKRKK